MKTPSAYRWAGLFWIACLGFAVWVLLTQPACQEGFRRDLRDFHQTCVPSRR